MKLETVTRNPGANPNSLYLGARAFAVFWGKASLWLFVLGLLSWFGPAAMAQGAAAQAGQSESTPEEFAIEEIIVVAQKREQRLQEVPVAITAFDHATLEDLNYTSSLTLDEQVPNMHMRTSFNASNPQLYIRGVGTVDFNQNASNKVSLYFDEVYVEAPSASVSQMFDLERIEVLRGPQGTLYGRNSTGGAVNFVSRLPSGDYGFRGEVTVGRFNEFDVDVAFEFPIIEDKLSARIAAVSRNRDGYTKNLFDGRPRNDVDNQAARAIFRYLPNENWEVLLNIHGSRNRSTMNQHESRGLLDPVTFEPCSDDVALTGACVDAFGYHESPDPYSGSQNLNGIEDVDTFGVTLKTIWSGAALTVKTISAYLQADRFNPEDGDASPNGLIEVTWDSDSWQFSEEIQVLSDPARQLSFIAGAYFLKEKVNASNFWEFLAELRRPGFACPEGCPFDPVNGPFNIRQAYNQDLTSYAVFGDVTYRLTDLVAISGGVRYTYDKKKFNFRTDFDEGGVLVAPIIPLVPQQKTWDAVTWSAKLEFQPNEDFLAYGGVSRGFQSGGFPGGGFFDPAEVAPYDPETLIAYEAGIKSTWLQRRLRLNVAAFYYNYDDLQVFFLTPDFVLVLDNATNAKVKGLEVEARVLPLPGLDISFGLGLLDANYGTFTSGGEDFSGNPLIGAPDLNLNAIVQYEIPLGEIGFLRLRAEYSHSSKIFYDPSARDRISSGEKIDLVNGRITFEPASGRIQLSLWARNLFDETYILDAFDVSDFGFDQLIYNVPRTMGVTLVATF